MKLQFDSARLINDIIRNLNLEMDLIAKILIEFMIGELSQTHINPNNPEMNEWRLNVIEALRFRAVAVSGQLVREIGILSQDDEGLMAQALSLEFGTGKLMNSTANPWYGEFISSEYYHDSRGSKEMFTLPGEMVFEPSTGLWYESKATNQTSMEFMAQDPSLYWTNVFGNSAIMAQTYFDKGIDNAISRIDFSNYLIVK